jgi:cytidylate kinase
VKNRYSNPFVITLDGTAASGKSTTAKELGILFDIAYLNSGSLYRACTCAYLKKMPNVELEGNRIDEASAISIIKSTAINFKPDGNVLIDGSEEDLRTSPITTLVPLISQIPEIRQEVRNLQYKFAETFKKIVADGRDLGTVVFPTAFVKFYIDASVEERAKRRNVNPDELLQRDRLDMSRHESPLKPAQDAIIIDNTHMEVHDTLFHCAIKIILKMSKSLNLNEDFFNIQTKKCIILSGPACSGKTSLIKSLKSDQYYVIEEAAERVIQYYKDNLIPLPWEDPETTELSWMKFQTKIMETQIQDIKTIPNNIQLIVMDRGLEDTQAYYREATGNDMPNWKSTRDLLNTNNVIVYYLNPVCKKNNNITDNGIRFEEEMEQLKNQYQFIKSEYERYDYNVICEPKLTSLEDRLKVLKKLISRS